MNDILASDAAQLAEDLREPGNSYISPELFASRMHISVQNLAQLACVDRTTLLRSPDNEKAQTYMRKAISVIGMTMEVNGGDAERAIYWYRNIPLVELGGLTAEQYVDQGEIGGILDYVQNLSAGATG